MPTGAVSISAPVNRLTDAVVDQLSPKLLSVAKEVSCLLGYNPA